MKQITREKATPSSRALTGAPLERIWHLHSRLRRSERFNAEIVAADRGCAAMTIKRDIAFMRDRLGMPIEWDAVERTYLYTRDCESLPLLVIDPRDALTLALVGRVCEVSHGGSFGRRLDDILKKIASVLGGAVSVAVDSLDHVHAAPETNTSGNNNDLDEFERFFPILEAIHDRRELLLDYTSASAPEAEKRVVQPLALGRLEQAWVLIAYDPERGGLRHFLLVRIRKLARGESTFERPPDFNPAEYIRGCMGRFAGDTLHDVRIALDAHAAFYARERPWHPSQKLADLPDGRVELSLRVNHLADVKSAVLRWADHAEVLSPSELREDVRSALESALDRYGPTVRQ